MNLFWAVLILFVVIIVLFGILPNILQKEEPVTYKPVTFSSPLVDHDAFEKQESRRMLDAHYENAKESVPEDFPRKQVGDCPYSKPMSSDLPMRDIPRCIMTKTDFTKFSNVFKQ